MKLKIGESVYLQNFDLGYMTRSIDVPYDLYEEMFKEGTIFITSGGEDGLRFDHAFKTPETVKWLMEQDWIIDYEEYAKMPIPELTTLLESTIAERTAQVAEFNTQDKAYRNEHFKEKSLKFDRLGHKIYSLKCLISALEGKLGLKFTFPTDYKDQYLPHSPVINPTPKKPGFFRRLFGHSSAQ